MDSASQMAVVGDQALAGPMSLPQPIVIPQDQIPDVDGMEEGSSLQAQYMEFLNAGEVLRGVFVGFSTMNSKKKDDGGAPIQIPVAHIQNKNGIFVNAGANLTSQLANCPVGTPVQITYKGKEKTGSGMEVKVFEVKMLVPRGSRSGGAVSSLPIKHPTEIAKPAPKSGADIMARAQAIQVAAYVRQQVESTQVREQVGKVMDPTKIKAALSTKLLNLCKGDAAQVTRILMAVYPHTRGDGTMTSTAEDVALFQAFAGKKNPQTGDIFYSPDTITKALALAEYGADLIEKDALQHAGVGGGGEVEIELPVEEGLPF